MPPLPPCTVLGRAVQWVAPPLASTGIPAAAASDQLFAPMPGAQRDDIDCIGLRPALCRAPWMGTLKLCSSVLPQRGAQELGRMAGGTEPATSPPHSKPFSLPYRRRRKLGIVRFRHRSLCTGRHVTSNTELKRQLSIAVVTPACERCSFNAAQLKSSFCQPH